MIKRYYSKLESSFYTSDIHDDIPADVVEITETQHRDLLASINDGCIVFDDMTVSSPPPDVFYKFKGGEWVIDNEKKQAYEIEKNREKLLQLTKDAQLKITLLQDAIELNIAKVGDAERLNDWKKYRVLLSRIDVSSTDVVWPELPA